MQKMNKSLTAALRPHFDQMQKMADLSTAALRPHFDRMQKMADLINAGVMAYAEWLALDAKAKQILEATGWLPIPGFEEYLRDVDIEGEAELVDQRYERFVDEKWPWIRKNMEQQIAVCNVDEETKRIFRECLDNHEDRRYVSVCRCLFAENERALRVLLKKKTGGIDVKQQLKRNQVQYTQHGQYAGNPYRSHLMEPLEKMYEGVQTEADCKQMETNLNRHVGLHGIGLHSYDTKKDSFNVLVLALHWFCCLSANNIESDKESQKT